jgi:hypothetical protein
MPRIIDVIRQKRDANVTAGINGNHGPAEATGDLARAAVIAGYDSPAWEAFMNQFQGLTGAQLGRLMATDGTRGNPSYDIRRAYLVANGVCGMPSPDTAQLPRFVEGIDDDNAGLPYLTEPPFDPSVLH